jgi:hypothetical protein
VADVHASLPLTFPLVVRKGIFVVIQQWLVLQWLTFCVATADIPTGCAEGNFWINESGWCCSGWRSASLLLTSLTVGNRIICRPKINK